MLPILEVYFQRNHLIPSLYDIQFSSPLQFRTHDNFLDIKHVYAKLFYFNEKTGLEDMCFWSSLQDHFISS